MILDQKRLLIY